MEHLSSLCWAYGLSHSPQITQTSKCSKFSLVWWGIKKTRKSWRKGKSRSQKSVYEICSHKDSIRPIRNRRMREKSQSCLNYVHVPPLSKPIVFRSVKRSCEMGDPIRGQIIRYGYIFSSIIWIKLTMRVWKRFSTSDLKRLKTSNESDFRRKGPNIVGEMIYKYDVILESINGKDWWSPHIWVNNFKRFRWLKRRNEEWKFMALRENWETTVFKIESKGCPSCECQTDEELFIKEKEKDWSTCCSGHSYPLFLVFFSGCQRCLWC